jgi:energy-coupling factor transporter transmembrane protein EcfT
MRTNEYVRSLLFAVRIDSPLARLHVVTKLLAVLVLSLIIVRTMRTEAPDPVAALLIWLLALVGLALGGAIHWLFRSYLLILLPALAGVVLMWIVFGPSHESELILRVHANLPVALTKGLGYGALVFCSLLLVTTSRDIEFTGAMRQFGVPYVASFFMTTMLRSLNMALVDYSTIRQAQIARGAMLRKRNPFGMLSDLAHMAVPLTATMLHRSSEVGDAALIRGLTMDTRQPTEFHEIQPFSATDWIVLAGCALWLVASHALQFNLTQLLGVSW